MKFIYDYARLPRDQKLLTEIHAAANRLFNKMSTLNVAALDISDYNKNYFGSKLARLISALQLYSYILSWSIAKSDVSFDRFVFLEYGGGSGMLSLLAKELDIGTVIYNDIYDVSCRDAKVIAGSIGVEADHYVEGDVDKVISFLKLNNINCNAVGSYDVIEHIYDIKTFFKKISLFSNNPLTIVMSSGANTFNPMIKSTLVKGHLKAEYEDRKKKWGHKERDCLKSYLNVRKEMVYSYLQEFDKSLTEDEIMQLARNTRGMIQVDIWEYVDEYLKAGRFPSCPNHPTNTCDPYTGNWAEHLMNPYYLSNILLQSGFKTEILSGYYGRSQNMIKRFLGSVLNISIYAFKKQGIRIAPFYTVYGRRD